MGTHIIGEFRGVNAALLDDHELLESALRIGIQKSQATLCGLLHKKFTPQGVSIVALLAESHATLHTYPEHGMLYFDAFTCGSCNAMCIADELRRSLRPSSESIRTILR